MVTLAEGLLLTGAVCGVSALAWFLINRINHSEMGNDHPGD